MYVQLNDCLRAKNLINYANCLPFIIVSSGYELMMDKLVLLIQIVNFVYRFGDGRANDW